MALTIRTALTTACVITMAIALGAQEMPKSTMETIKGTPKVTTQKISGMVVFVEGNTLVVRMDSGEVHAFQPPESRRFIIDGKEVTIHDLRPGTKLKATITTTATPVTERTTTVGSGKVMHVSGNTVVVTLPNGENRTYTVQPSYRFEVEGKQATVKDLKKGMILKANLITEDPRTEIARNTVVTGEAPPLTPVAAETPRELEKPAAAAAPAPEPAPTAAAAPEPAPTVPPASPAESSSPWRLVSLIALLIILGIIVLVWMRSRKREERARR